LAVDLRGYAEHNSNVAEKTTTGMPVGAVMSFQPYAADVTRPAWMNIAGARL
jgi:hypothetical protein